MSKKKRVYKRSGVSPEQFVRIWQAAESAKEVGQKIGLKSQAASSRATYFRNKGINLKMFPRGGKRYELDVKGLARLARKTGK